MSGRSLGALASWVRVSGCGWRGLESSAGAGCRLAEDGRRPGRSGLRAAKMEAGTRHV